MTHSLSSVRPASPSSALAKFLVTTIVTALTGTALAMSAPAPASAVAVQTSKASSVAASTYERRVQRLINVRRSNHGLRALRHQRCSDGTAERWSRHLARTNLFYHQSMTTVLNSCNARYAGETLGRGSIPPRRLVRMWMRSPGHRAILLTRQARRIGIGAKLDQQGQWVVAANFIRR